MCKYSYKLTSTGSSSAQYGDCEICHKHMSEAFTQSETREYERPDGSKGQTYAECKPTLFGHENCLKAIRR